MSVSGVSTLSVDHSSAPAVHGVDEIVGLRLGNLPPHLGNGYTKLGCCLRSGVQLVDPPLKGIPKMFNGV